jgi:hypothetical protein
MNIYRFQLSLTDLDTELCIDDGLPGVSRDPGSTVNHLPTYNLLSLEQVHYASKESARGVHTCSKLSFSGVSSPSGDQTSLVFHEAPAEVDARCLARCFRETLSQLSETRPLLSEADRDAIPEMEVVDMKSLPLAAGESEVNRMVRDLPGGITPMRGVLFQMAGRDCLVLAMGERQALRVSAKDVIDTWVGHYQRTTSGQLQPGS